MENFFCLPWLKKNSSEFLVAQRAKSSEQRAKSNEQRVKRFTSYIDKWIVLLSYNFQRHEIPDISFSALRLRLIKVIFYVSLKLFVDSNILCDDVILDIPGYNLVRADYLVNAKSGGVSIYFPKYLPLR